MLIDFSNLVYSSIFSSLSQIQITKPENCPVNYSDYLYTFQQKTESILSAIFPDAAKKEYYYVLDEKPLEKYRIFPEYKGKRKPGGGFPFDVKQRVIDMLAHWNCTVISAKDEEADDAIASYIAQNPDKKFVVATTDKDLWQLCQLDNVRIYNFHDKKKEKRYITTAHLESSFLASQVQKLALKDKNLRFHYSHIALAKTLWGDASDNIPNLIKRQQVALLPIVAQTDGSYESFQEKVRENWGIISKECRDLLVEHKNQLKIHYKLVNLKYDCPVICETIFEKNKRLEQAEDRTAIDIGEIPF